MKKLLKKYKAETKTIENTFQADYYQLHNVARLKHLEELNFDFQNKTVLEIGAGVGDHTYYLLIKGANVTSTDARPELVKQIKNRFAVESFVLDVEKDIDKIKALSKFDIIYCYGLLYHISNPAEFIAALKGKTDLLLLETCVSNDFRKDDPYIVDENALDPTQATSGKGCRPTRRWLANEMQKSFNHVYFPLSQPQHEQFAIDWSEEFEDRVQVKRAIFIASNNELNNSKLTKELPKKYQVK